MNTKSRGTAFGLPIDVAIARMQQRNAEFIAASERMPASNHFGRLIAEAVKRRTASNSGRKTERGRYRLTPRKPTASD